MRALVIALCFALGLAWGSRAGALRALPPTSQAPPTASVASRLSGPVPVPERAPAPSAPPASRSPTLDAALDELRAAIQALPGPAPGAPRRFTGRVRDVAGAPVEGVHVRLEGRERPDPPRSESGPPDAVEGAARLLLEEVAVTLDPELDALRATALEVRARARRAAAAALTRGETRTDAQGRFSLEAPHTGLPFVDLRLEGYEFRDARSEDDGRGPPFPVDGAPLEIVALPAAEAPAPEPVVAEAPPPAPVVAAPSEEALAVLRVRFHAPPPPVEPYDHERPASYQPSLVLFAVPPGTQASDVPSEQLRAIFPNHFAEDAAAPREPDVLEFRGLRPGHHALTVCWGDDGYGPPRLLEVGPGVTETTYDAPGWQEVGCIRARAFGPDGGVLVGAGWQLGGRETYGGDVLLPPVSRPARGPCPGWVRVSVSSLGWLMLPRPAPPSHEVTARFALPGRLLVRVTGATREVMSALFVVATPRALGERPPSPLLHAGYEQRIGGAADGEGSIALEPLQPGAYIVTALIGSGRHTPEARLRAVSAEVRAGADTIVTIPMPPLHEVTLTSDTRVGVLIHAPGDVPPESAAELVSAEEVFPTEPCTVSLPAGEWELRWNAGHWAQGVPRAGFLRFRTPGTERIAIETGP